jgi:hypothetical protein
MNKLLWIVQRNMNGESVDLIIQACKDLGYEYYEFFAIPFETLLPPRIHALTKEPPFIFNASTTIIMNALKDPLALKGIFTNENFKPMLYLQHYGDAYLNFDSKLMKFSDVNTLDPEKQYFVRCNDDSKSLSGGVKLGSSLQKMAANIIPGEHQFTGSDIISLDTEIVISDTKEINREWRLFFVDGKCITGSEYFPRQIKQVPDEVIEFAISQAQIWLPHKHVVMDICQLNNGDLKVVECNCINGSGMYASSVHTIVRELSISVIAECEEN